MIANNRKGWLNSVLHYKIKLIHYLCFSLHSKLAVHMCAFVNPINFKNTFKNVCFSRNGIRIHFFTKCYKSDPHILHLVEFINFVNLLTVCFWFCSITAIYFNLFLGLCLYSSYSRSVVLNLGSSKAHHFRW